jgi:hypothetical protein
MRAASGGDTSTSSGLTGSGAARTVTGASILRIPQGEGIPRSGEFRRPEPGFPPAQLPAHLGPDEPIEVVMAREAPRTLIGSAGERTRNLQGVPQRFGVRSGRVAGSGFRSGLAPSSPGE